MTVGERNKKMNLTGVPETMLQTIYARAKESKGRGAICDKKAEEIVSRLDYDFSLADKDTAMHSGVIARTIVLDRLTTAWLATHPGGVVVNIACGLDTRCYRMKGYAHWYNLDLPETMAVRVKLLPESGLISQIAMSAMDNWGDEIKASAGHHRRIDHVSVRSGRAANLCSDFWALSASNCVCGNHESDDCKAVQGKIH